MAAITSAAIGVASAGAQVWGAAKEKKRLKKELANLETPELNNAYENLQIPTLGTDLKARQDVAALNTGVDALKAGGVRSVMGGLPQLTGQMELSSEKNRAYLDGLAWDKNKLVGEDNVRIRNTKWKSYEDEVAGLGAGINSANHNMWNGISSLGNSLGSMAGAIGEKGGKGGKGADYDYDFIT